jgi:DNA invertase Pin-like site-specific DNA recombinase
MTEGMLKMMGVFSELERNIISQRVKSGMENAKAKGIKTGRRPTVLDDIPQAFFKHYPMYKSGSINKREYARLCNLSYPTIYKYLSIIETVANKNA